MNIIISHPTSNQNNRAAVNGLLQNQILFEFHTSLAFFPGSVSEKLSAINIFKEIKRRSFLKELKPYTKTSPFTEGGRILSGKFGFNKLIENEKSLFSIDSVYEDLDKKTAKRLRKLPNNNTVSAIYAYEDGAYHSFKQAKHSNIACLYDLPIGYWRTARDLLAKEIEIWPEWAPTLTGFQDSEDKLQKKDEELAMADSIFVASSFTAKSLNSYPGKLAPIKVIPYGFPKPVDNRNYKHLKRPLKLLFVGGLSQRKGIANMFAAVEKLLPHVQLTVIGGKLNNDCEILNNKLLKHKWIPSLPHEKVLEQMRMHDILLFPSLFEGFGLVITEAMSQGTPVITTDRTAGPDLIEHGINGWLVQAGSTESLQSCIEDILEQPSQIEKVGKAAIATAKKRPWDVYGKELAKAISSQ